jgi:hypothetical protein
MAKKDIFERNGAQPAKEPVKKIGAGHAAAMGRLGLRELRNAFNPSRESVADTEMGLYGTQTQGEIAQSRGNLRGGGGLNAHQEKPLQRQPAQKNRKPPQQGRSL